MGESELKRALENVNADMDQRVAEKVDQKVAEKVDQLVAEKVNAIASTMYADFGAWFKGGMVGPAPKFNLAATTSNVVPAADHNPTKDASPAATAPRNDQGPSPAATAPPTHQGPSPTASAPLRRSPSIPATVRGPSPLAELNALEVIQTRQVSYMCYFIRGALDH